MIGKLIVSGEDREHCLERSKRALDHFDVEGVHTTIPFHRLMLDDETFVSGEHTTKYLDQELDEAELDAAVERWGSAPDAGGAGDGSSTAELAVEVDGKRFDVVVEDGLPKAPTGGADTGGEFRRIVRRRKPGRGCCRCYHGRDAGHHPLGRG